MANDKKQKTKRGFSAQRKNKRSALAERIAFLKSVRPFGVSGQNERYYESCDAAGNDRRETVVRKVRWATVVKTVGVANWHGAHVYEQVPVMPVAVGVRFPRRTMMTTVPVQVGTIERFRSRPRMNAQVALKFEKFIDSENMEKFVGRRTKKASKVEA